jgi:hypothetical protein
MFGLLMKNSSQRSFPAATEQNRPIASALVLTRAWGEDLVSIVPSSAKSQRAPVFKPWMLAAALAVIVAAPSWCRAQEEKTGQPPANPNVPAAEALPGPDPIPEVKLVPDLHTIPVPHDRVTYNVQMVDASLLPRDKEGIWVLDFAFKPLRIKTVEIPGKGRRQIHYLYYKVINRTGKTRMFVPQFVMVNEAGQKFEDNVVPQAIPFIQNREDPTIPVLGAVNIMGVIPPSTKPDVDDAVFGVATWEKWDPKSDRFSIYVRGLSDGYKESPNPSGGKPNVKYKTLRLDFIRRGDHHNLNEKEIELGDPPYEWVYW